MIVIEANILIYAHRAESAFYGQASACLRELAEGRAAWAIPWPCLHEFYGIVTHPKRYLPPSTLAQAIYQIKLWMGNKPLIVIGETQAHWSVLQPMLNASDAKGSLVHEARIAAICLQHGVREFWTADWDFFRFQSLKCHNPLIAA